MNFVSQDVLNALRSVLPTVWTTTAYGRYTSAADAGMSTEGGGEGGEDKRNYGVRGTSATNMAPSYPPQQQPEIDSDEGLDDTDDYDDEENSDE